MLPNDKKEKGFMMFDRELPGNPPVDERVEHFEEFAGTLPPDRVERQALRCMDCGVPFCHFGCPLDNLIPDFNNALKDEDWEKALKVLHSTNNFPEFTGRVCPAPCEPACVLGINQPPVAIEFIEKCIGEYGWEKGIIKPEPPEQETGKSVAVVGSGPAGLAAAQQLRRAGHKVTVFERSDEPGGLLMYGIPNFKLSKDIVKRRLDQLEAEGIEFRCNAWVGKDLPTSELDAFDAILLTMGATEARTLDIPGSDLDGIHLAMDFLPQQNRRNLSKEVEGPEILATDKNVVVIGAGDTGSDCIGTSVRQGATNVQSIELLPRPPLERDDTMLWPSWPMIFRTSTSHEEGGKRDWSILTKSFTGKNGHVQQLNAVRIEWSAPNDRGQRKMVEVPGSEFSMDCDLVLLAMGFLHPEQDTVAKDLELELDKRGNIKTDDNFKTGNPKVYAAGDARIGQSLVVRAIAEGRKAARRIDEGLTDNSELFDPED